MLPESDHGDPEDERLERLAEKIEARRDPAAEEAASRWPLPPDGTGLELEHSHAVTPAWRAVEGGEE